VCECLSYLLAPEAILKGHPASSQHVHERVV
jgi:hypothetical protein